MRRWRRRKRVLWRWRRAGRPFVLVAVSGSWTSFTSAPLKPSLDLIQHFFLRYWQCVTEDASLAVIDGSSLMMRHWWCITDGASLTVHHWWCITHSASPMVHRWKCVTDSASLTVDRWQCITNSGSVTMHYWQCITDGVSPMVHH